MTDHSSLAAHMDSLKGVRVLCVGDVMLDRFVYGEVARISPEAPVPICRVTEETAMLGGAGNVVRNLDALGIAVNFVSVVGNDGARDEIRELLKALPTVNASLITDPKRRTTIKERFIAGVQQLLRVDRESNISVDARIAQQVDNGVAKALATAGAVVVSDYGKGVLTDDSLKTLIDGARQAGCPVVVDPKGNDYSRYAGAFLVTPNRQELIVASGMAAESDEEIVAAGRHIVETCAIEYVLVTRSGDGMTLVSADQTHHLPAEAREVFDVSGAGDTVVATLAASLAGGVPLLEAAQIANVAASIVVGKVGTAVAHPDDIVDAIHRQNLLLPGEGKFLALTPALDRIAAWRKRGDRIGFTNGCFDLIHPGHVALLSKSRAACDRLVVGLNSDESVRRLKGETRPVQNEASRAAVLASLASVDLVIIFSEDTPVALIEALKPDVLAKGADYTIDQVVGAEIVQAYGGSVLLVDLEEGHSTTATIERLAN
ncbi:MAG: D-glycero-beta-D-manno-heptose-7-phosphate kinase [Rhodospirillaceae bacterium]|nr:D-glycero-beta-D-manno-heptose-7-phosphate kinase [Rhodospirillaceae bacterium]MBT5458166.1 D-glycero-beta-D-manno-heptose-7-phosphate kinase [Rhodospirillaceae bacterium]